MIAFAAFSVSPLIVIVTLVFRSRVRASFREIRVKLARLNAFLNENLSGMGTVQMLTRESRNYDEFRAAYHKGRLDTPPENGAGDDKPKPSGLNKRVPWITSHVRGSPEPTETSSTRTPTKKRRSRCLRS